MKIAVVLVIVAVVAVGYIPVRKAYWDYQVNAMCKNDGGLKVLELTSVSRSEYELFRVAPGQGFAIRPEQNSGAAPIVRRSVQTTIREWNPQVWKLEQSAVRRSDGKILATHVSYARVGGDFPTGIFHDSSFLCPGGPALQIKDIVAVKD